MKIRTKLLVAPLLTLLVFFSGMFFVVSVFQKIMVVNQARELEISELNVINKISSNLDKTRITVGEIILGQAQKDELEENWKELEQNNFDLDVILSKADDKTKTTDDEENKIVSEENSLDLLREIEAQEKILKDKATQSVVNFESGDVEGAKASYAEMKAIHLEIDGFFDKMMKDNLAEFDSLKNDSNATQKEAHGLIVGLLTAVTLIGLVSSLLNSRGILKELRGLNNAVTEILFGDLSQRIKNSSKDEIGELAALFNKMVERLQKEHDSLESKVKERTKEMEASKAGVEYEVLMQTEKLREQNENLTESRKAVLNIVEDVEKSEKELQSKAQELERAISISHEQKERAESILRFLKSIGDGIVATDPKGKIIFINEAAEKLTGVSGEEAIGKDSFEILQFFRENNLTKQIKIVSNLLASQNNNKETKDYNYVLKKKNGLNVNVSFTASYIYDQSEKKQGCILVIRDVTEERELEKTKDNFLSVAAHQLRTPLSGIRWSLGMLLDGDVGELPAQAKEVVENINENNLRLITLVNELLDVSRINLGKVVEPPTNIMVVDKISEVVKSESGAMAKHQRKLIFAENEQKGLAVFMSPQRFFESIENLISNAIRYTSTDDTIEIKISKEGENVKIAVCDSGIGIPKSEQPNIFNKFFRAQNAIQKAPNGSGLGLNVVRSFVEEAGGKVYFESEEGKGTTFFLELPFYIGEEQSQEKPEIKPKKVAQGV